MNTFKEIKVKLDEDIENNQNIFFELLDNQSLAHTSVIKLKEEFKKIKKIVSNDSQIEQKIKVEEETDKISDLMALKVSQILQHRETIMKYKGISQVLTDETKMFSSNLNQNILFRSNHDQNIEEENTGPQFTIEKIQYYLLDGRVDEGFEEFKIIAKEISDLGIDDFISIQILRETIINEIVIKIEQSNVTREISYIGVERYLTNLLYLIQEKIAIESFFNYTNKIIAAMEFTTLRDKIKIIISKFPEIISNMDRIFASYIPTQDYRFYLEPWMKNHVFILIKEILNTSTDNKNSIMQLEELRIELGEFDIKGFCYDFIIDREIMKIKINNKI